MPAHLRAAIMTMNEQRLRKLPPAFAASAGWPAMVFVGIVTVILGLIISLHPSGSLNVVAVLIGVLLVISGIFHLVRVFDRSEPYGVWPGIAGVTAFSGWTAERRGWWIFFGLIGLIAGIVVVAVPTTSVTVLAVLVGIWFIAEGLVEIVGGFMQRHAASKSQASDGQPAGEGAALSGASGVARS